MRGKFQRFPILLKILETDLFTLFKKINDKNLINKITFDN